MYEAMRSGVHDEAGLHTGCLHRCHRFVTRALPKAPSIHPVTGRLLLVDIWKVEDTILERVATASENPACRAKRIGDLRSSPAKSSAIFGPLKYLWPTLNWKANLRRNARRRVRPRRASPRSPRLGVGPRGSRRSRHWNHVRGRARIADPRGPRRRR